MLLHVKLKGTSRQPTNDFLLNLSKNHASKSNLSDVMTSNCVTLIFNFMTLGGKCHFHCSCPYMRYIYIYIYIYYLKSRVLTVLHISAGNVSGEYNYNPILHQLISTHPISLPREYYDNMCMYYSNSKSSEPFGTKKE